MLDYGFALSLLERLPQRRLPHLPPVLPMSRAAQLVWMVTDLAGFLDQGYRRVGPTYTLDVLGFEPQVVFTAEEPLRDIIGGSPEDFGQSNDIVAFFVGTRSIFLLNGQPHHHARRRILSAFSGERMYTYGRIMKETADRWLDRLRPGMRISGIEAGRDLALDIVLKALFGVKPGPEYDRIQGLVRTFMEGGHSPVATALSLSLPAARMRDLVIGRRAPQTLDRLSMPIDPLGWLPAIRASRQLLDALLVQIRRRRETLDDGGQDVLAHMLRTARAEGHTYTDADAFDETLTLLLAGHDTTAVTLSSALYRLARSPRIAARLREELDAAFPNRPLEPRELDRLPYLTAVVNECFRLDSLALGVARRLLRKRTIGGYELPAGTLVLAYVYPRQRDPNQWPSPDDFEPEQFLDRHLKPHEFTPFGGGYRRCVGAPFAMYELKVLLAQAIRRADLAVPAGTTLGRGMLGMMVAPVGPVPLDVLAVRPDPGSVATSQANARA